MTDKAGEVDLDDMATAASDGGVFMSLQAKRDDSSVENKDLSYRAVPHQPAANWSRLRG